MEFKVLNRGTSLPDEGRNTAYLRIDNWNDFSYFTLFQVKVFDENGKGYELGDVKIAYKGQEEGSTNATSVKIDKYFTNLSEDYFSLGQSADYYKRLRTIPEVSRVSYLNGISDLVAHPELIPVIEDEQVFGTSLLRDVYLASIRGKFRNILEGNNESTPFQFHFIREENERMCGVQLYFDVGVDTKPPTNIHAIIGRNGVGKTTVLNGIVSAIRGTENNQLCRIKPRDYRYSSNNKDYFSSLISVSFSAFDPFMPPIEQSDPAKGTCYFYLGLKKSGDDEQLLGFKELRIECIRSLMNCFTQPDKAERWVNVIQKLSSDTNFAEMNLGNLKEFYQEVVKKYRIEERLDTVEYENRKQKMKEEYEQHVLRILKRMSSGHSVVFMTITRLVEKVDERSLVLLDEPESHLHPPLLSAFIRALSDLLISRNAIAIIATHSPVVLQEVPRNCVWKLFRHGKSMVIDRPKIETFGESVSDLTTEVFGLEVSNSGFHGLLKESVDEGKSYKDIIDDFNNQVGFEGRALLKVMISERDRDAQQ
ncbi:TPA: AAA family ATPase [Acinetobacter baumannii]|nr:AAA family ATPase [Acinetobacter baumannii]HCJ1340894.1 AAA family ATPase [Acinetobacter baumannii]